jgi:hypothetical protein
LVCHTTSITADCEAMHLAQGFVKKPNFSD